MGTLFFEYSTDGFVDFGLCFLVAKGRCEFRDCDGFFVVICKRDIFECGLCISSTLETHNF